MVERGSQTPWFQSLRRDAKLFALAGILSLIFGLLQPLAVSVAESLPGNFSICTTLGVKQPGGERPNDPRDIECPLCLSGHSCASPIVADTARAPAARAAVVAPTSPGPFSWSDFAHGSRAGDPPPAIRAPPFLV